jgi:hypothetical protein
MLMQVHERASAHYESVVNLCFPSVYVLLLRVKGSSQVYTRTALSML